MRPRKQYYIGGHVFDGPLFMRKLKVQRAKNISRALEQLQADPKIRLVRLENSSIYGRQQWDYYVEHIETPAQQVNNLENSSANVGGNFLHNRSLMIIPITSNCSSVPVGQTNNIAPQMPSTRYIELPNITITPLVRQNLGKVAASNVEQVPQKGGYENKSPPAQYSRQIAVPVFANANYNKQVVVGKNNNHGITESNKNQDAPNNYQGVPGLTNNQNRVVSQNLGRVAASNVKQAPQGVGFDNISPPAQYLRQTAVPAVANANYNNQTVVRTNNNQGITGANDNQVATNNYQGVSGLTNNQNSVVRQNLGKIAVSNVEQTPQRAGFENIRPPAQYLRQTAVPAVANANYNNQTVVRTNNNQGITGANDNQVAPNKYQGVSGLTNNQNSVVRQNLGRIAASNVEHTLQRAGFENINQPAQYLRQTAVPVVANANYNKQVVLKTVTQFANDFTMKILLCIDNYEVRNQLIDVYRKYGMSKEILAQEFKLHNLFLHEKLKEFANHLINYLKFYQVKNVQMHTFVLSVRDFASKNVKRSVYMRQVIWVMQEALRPHRDLCMANTGCLKEVYCQTIAIWQQDQENINRARRAQTGTLMSRVQKAQFEQQCKEYYLLYTKLWGNQTHQPQPQQHQGKTGYVSSPSMQPQSQPHLQPPVLPHDYPPGPSLLRSAVQQQQLHPLVQSQQYPSMSSGIPQPSTQSWQYPSMSSDVQRNQFSSAPQQLNQPVQSIPFSNERDFHANININRMPPNQNINATQSRIASELITTTSTFVPSWQHPSISSDVQRNQFSSAPQQLNQPVQSIPFSNERDFHANININRMPPNQNINATQSRIASELITTTSTFVPSVPQGQTNIQNISVQQTPHRSAHIAAPFSSAANNNNNFMIRLPLLKPLSKPYEQPWANPHVTATTTAAETVPIPAPAAEVVPAAQDISSSSDAVSDSLDKVSRQTLATGTSNSTIENENGENSNKNSDSVKQDDEDENVIDVDKFAELLMTEEVVCLNPEYFNLNHFLKTDFVVKMETDTEETPNAENNQEVGIGDSSGTEQAELKPHQQQQ